MSVSGISREVEVFPDDGFHGTPVGGYVAADAPRTGQAACPGAGKGPSADVDRDVTWTHFSNGFADGCITFTFIQIELLFGTAIVYLDEVKAPLVEVEVGILLSASQSEPQVLAPASE